MAMRLAQCADVQQQVMFEQTSQRNHAHDETDIIQHIMKQSSVISAAATGEQMSSTTSSWNKPATEIMQFMKQTSVISAAV